MSFNPLTRGSKTFFRVVFFLFFRPYYKHLTTGRPYGGPDRGGRTKTRACPSIVDFGWITVHTVVKRNICILYLYSSDNIIIH